MRRITRSPSPLRDLMRLLWQQPLWAIPFGLFFGTVYYNGPGGYVTAYEISVVFAYTIGLAVWGVGAFILAPRRRTGQALLARRRAGDRSGHHDHSPHQVPGGPMIAHEVNSGDHPSVRVVAAPARLVAAGMELALG